MTGVVWEGLSEEVTCKWSPPVRHGGQGPGRGNSLCQSPELTVFEELKDRLRG